MPFTQADLTEIDAAIKTGVLEVRYQDRMERFDSTDGLLKRRTLILAELSQTVGPPLSRQIRMITSSGF